MNQKINKTSEILIGAIVEGVRRKKGERILNLDLAQIDNSQCNHIIICHGNSNTQVEAIARSVEETVHELTGEDVWHVDGYRNSQWILLDYSDVMVHVFQKEFRNFYDLETLWADAKINMYNSEN
jgi:ribosome-associated protein